MEPLARSLWAVSSVCAPKIAAGFFRAVGPCGRVSRYSTRCPACACVERRNDCRSALARDRALPGVPHRARARSYMEPPRDRRGRCQACARRRLRLDSFERWGRVGASADTRRVVMHACRSNDKMTVGARLRAIGLYRERLIARQRAPPRRARAVSVRTARRRSAGCRRRARRAG